MDDKPTDLIAVIMAGGTGTRFWPLSTSERPKQFLRLFSEKSLLRMSYERVSGLLPPDRILVLTNQAFAGLVKEQLPELPDENIIGEPQKKDTAAAVGLAAMLCRKRFGNPVIVTLTADHLIEPVSAFERTVLSAAGMAARDKVLYTFGIKPGYPATGYGYLERGERVDSPDGLSHYELLRFVEKPDQETAQTYVDSGRYYWNSGMFVWSADAIIEQIENHLPEHARHIGQAVSHDRTPGWDKALQEAFAALRAISIDFGVMEKALQVRTIEAVFSWSDVGGWLALKDLLPINEDGNQSRGRSAVLDSHNNLVFCEDPDEMVMLIGVDDLVVARAGGKTLIVRGDRTEDLKKMVKKLKEP